MGGESRSVRTYVGSQSSLLRICITSLSDLRSTWYNLVMRGRFSSHFSFGIRRLVFRVCRILATTSELVGDMLCSTVLCSPSDVAAEWSTEKLKTSDMLKCALCVRVMGK
jgi:hypothetical protein